MMKRIDITTSFKKDYKREKRGKFAKTIDNDLIRVFDMLVNDEKLPLKYRDHALTGNWEDFRDCHVKPDLILIYQKTEDRIILARLGSHSELSL